MRDKGPVRWMQWRVKRIEKPPIAAPVFERRVLVNAVGTRGEEPGPDGIRHGFVARIRAEIAAGAYDTEERWLAAEERLLSRIEAGA
jgi:hypothetical protein